MFQTSVFPVPPGAKRTVTLRYSPALPQAGRADRFPLPAEHGQVHVARRSRRSTLRVTIESQDEHQERLQPDARGRDQAARRAARHGHLRGQERGARRPISACSTTSARASSGPAVLSYRPDERRRRLLPAPGQSRDQGRRRRSRPPKTVVFVVDRSGSMSGKKIEQAQEALKFVLNNLREGDLFNIVAYDSEVEIVPARVAAVTTTRPARRRSASSRASTPAAARTSTGR